MKGAGKFLWRVRCWGLAVCLAFPASAWPAPVTQTAAARSRLIHELADIGLPSRFLKILPPGFVKLEFARLENAAAEYHPGGHRMIFNRALSKDNQGQRFRPIDEIGNQELATIYHELFHAYFDYIDFAAGTPDLPPEEARLHAEARRLVGCRYAVVDVVVGPLQKGAHRKVRSESRRLADTESWDARNETWGIFVGWAIWNKLEATDRLTRRWDWEALEMFLDRLEAAHLNGDFTGYFEPADAESRKIIPRWYLAPNSAITALEITLLLEVVLEEPSVMARYAVHSVSGEEPVNKAC
jgi:hypothetical protein